MNDKEYYSRYNHFLKMDLAKVGSFRVIKKWLSPYQKKLDIGCGIGYLTNYMHATGIDVNRYAIARANKLFPKIEFSLFDGQRIAFEDASFDAVICYNVIEHLEEKDRKNMFDEIKRILRREGVVVFAYIDEDYFLNEFIGIFSGNKGKSDPTHKVSWTIEEFRNAIKGSLIITKEKRTSPYGKYTLITRHFKGELIIMARKNG